VIEVTKNIERPFFVRSRDDSMRLGESADSPASNAISRNAAPDEFEPGATLLSSYFDASLP